MTSRLRGPSTVKEGAKITSLGKHYREEHAEDLKPYKNGAKESRYHFGMTKHDVIRKNGREHKDVAPEDPDFLYRRSKQHFGAWEVKDVVHEENSKAKKPEDRGEESHLTNGKHKSEPRDEGYVGSLPREHRARTESGDRDHPKRAADFEAADSRNSTRAPRSMRNNGSKEEVEEDRDLSGEMDHLHVDSRSPDRRIRAMIERFKSREEGKLKSRREQSSLSPEKEEHSARSKSATRNDSRPDHSPDDWTNNRSDRNRPEDEDREDLRRSSRHKYREPDKSEREESRDHRSRSKEKRRDSSHPDARRVDSLRQKSEHSNDRSHRRRSKEVEDDQSRSKESQKRRSYTYEGNPDDFDIRIQRYERALPEPRKDPEFSRRSSSMDREQDLGRKDSFKEHDRQPRKNSFKTSDSHKKRESSLNRKTSFKDPENDVYKKNSFKNHQDSAGRYFSKDQEMDLSRKSSFKEHGPEIVRKSSFKEPTGGEYGRIQKTRGGEEVDRKNSFKEHQAGVSRITFKDCDGEPARNNTCKDDQEAGRVSFKERGEIPRRNSFKEKTVEFGGISYKEDDDIEERHAYRDRTDSKSFKDYPESTDPPNGRYEFGKVSFRGQDEELQRSPPREEEDSPARRKSSSKERDASTKRRVSLRSKTRDAAERKSERHARPLSPPRIEEPDRKEDSTERDAFSTKAWHESNKLFSAKYLREHSRFRTTPEGHADLDRDYLEANSCQDRRSPRRATPERAKHVCELESEPKDLKIRSDLSETSERFPGKREDARVTSTQNGATIIRIRAPSDADSSERRRRRRQEPHVETRRRRQLAEEGDESEEEEPEEEQQLRVRSRRETFMPSRAPTAPTAPAPPTPSRRLWNYREGGVLITDVEEGQPCLQCEGTCPGFSPHTWR